MKTLLHTSTYADDLARFHDAIGFRAMLDGLDGAELSLYGEDACGVIPKDAVVGVHLSAFPYWLDLWRGDESALMAEFGTREALVSYYGGNDADALLWRWRSELDRASAYGAEYVVFHVADASTRETFSRRYRHTAYAVMQGACEVLDELFRGRANAPLLLLENLWQPGLTFTDPRETAYLLEHVPCANAGLLLDTGHLMHTNDALIDQADALRYINAMLDAHGSLVHEIRGMHFNASVTGESMRRAERDADALPFDFSERLKRVYELVFSIDRHEPFICAGVEKLVSRVAPDYLTLELISESRAQHRALLDEQLRALGRGR